MLRRIYNKLDDKDELKKGVNCFLNPYSYLQLRKNPELLDAVDKVYVDGMFLLKLLKLISFPVSIRRSFDNTSLAPVVFENLQSNGKTIAIVGSDQKSMEGFKSHILKKYPKLKLVFVRNGYFDSHGQLLSVQKELIKINPDCILIGMGTPLQERFLVGLKRQGWNGIGYTCGGFIHQTASKGSEYYPRLINKFNLRFLYRMYDEPKLIKRYTVDYSKFLFCFTLDAVRYKCWR